MPILSDYWNKFQICLFPRLESVLEEPITENLKQFIRPYGWRVTRNMPPAPSFNGWAANSLIVGEFRL